MEGLNSHLKSRYNRLERRALFLRNRILRDTGAATSQSKDRGELSSIEWAMRIIVKYYKEHPHEDDGVKPCEECINGINPSNGEECGVCKGTGEVPIPHKIRKMREYIRQ